MSAALEAWLRDHHDPKAFAATPLFRLYGRRWSHWALWSRRKKAAATVGLKNAKLYEGTRHTFATNALAAGANDRALQDFLGHRDPKMTRKYAKLRPAALAQVVDLLDKKR
jgi:integrase/recombinase XerD